MSDALIVIPARLASTRFPGKPLHLLRGAGGAPKPLVQWTWEAAVRVEGVRRVVVATDSHLIAAAVRQFGGEALLTSPECSNGTERCAEALDALGGQYDIILNLQGDAPLTPAGYLSALLARMRSSVAAVATPAVKCSASLLSHLRADEEAGRVGGTTVVASRSGRALYFSKRILPFGGGSSRAPVLLHVGAYAYRAEFLRAYRSWPVAALEEAEGLEQLRFLENDVAVDLVEVDSPEWALVELNNPSDVDIVEAALARAHRAGGGDG